MFLPLVIWLSSTRFRPNFSQLLRASGSAGVEVESTKSWFIVVWFYDIIVFSEFALLVEPDGLPPAPSPDGENNNEDDDFL